MMGLGPHAGFIVAAYAAGIVTVIGLIAWVWLDYQAQRRALNGLEQGGVRRRARRSGRK